MSLHSVKTPDIGEGIAEVEIAAWHVELGDIVTEDQPLADLMTDKATVEVPSPVFGRVIALGGEVGKVMQVGTELIRIETADEDKPPLPVAPSIAEGGTKSLASPSVRQHARDHDIDLVQVKGSGPDGRILREDIDACLAATDRPPLRLVQAERHVAQDWEEVVPVIGLRRKIAQKMQAAKQHIPHFTYVEEIDMTECEALRVRLNEKYEEQRGRLTLIPLIVRALVLAIREFPQINTRYDDAVDMMTRYGAVHLGVATQTEGGLMVPVLRNAEALDLWSCAREITQLAEAARTGKATREELSGSTITLTSLGALGGIVATPIINHPEVAIVGVNRMVERPMIRNGLVVARQMMNLSSSFDHRVVDGMDAAKFIQAVRGYLEFPATLFVE